ncbi:MAG: hypothetical protein HY558_05755 [Euryarchaeota archaeon]|nr:hypothetical protein [Euryarchaeota archaeon]
MPASAHFGHVQEVFGESLGPVVGPLVREAEPPGSQLELVGILATPDYFRATNRSPLEMGVDPDRHWVVLLLLDIHWGELSDPDWNRSVLLTADGAPRPLLKSAVLQDSPHHRVAALEFARGTERPGALQLNLSGVEEGLEQTMAWSPVAAGPSPPALAQAMPFVAIIGGFLLYLSPCFLELTGVYVGLISGVVAEEMSSSADRRRMRRQATKVAALYVSGFALLYTTAGLVAGFGGQLMQGSFFDALSFPLRILAGGLLIFMGVRNMGLLPKKSGAPYPLPKGDTCTLGGSFLLGAGFGCLQCFRGSVVSGFLLFSWLGASPVNGALLLLSLSLAFGIPFLASAWMVGGAAHRFRDLSLVSHYAKTGSAVLLVFLGVLIFAYDQHPVLEFFGALGGAFHGLGVPL